MYIYTYIYIYIYVCVCVCIRQKVSSNAYYDFSCWPERVTLLRTDSFGNIIYEDDIFNLAGKRDCEGLKKKERKNGELY
jgi:hypothetical protein